MKTKKLSPLLAIVITAHPLSIATAAAQNPVVIDELVITGNYNPVGSEKMSAAISVLNREQLLQLSSHSLVDALRHVPGLWVEEQGGPGGVTAISLRGAESNHTLVLLDGVQLNDPTNTRGGAFDLHGININSVQRIEIIRGAQSSVYGSDALAGVIHIITTESDKNATHINAGAGEDGAKNAGINTSGRVAQMGYAVSVQGRDAGEPITGSSAKNTEVITKLDWANEKQRLDVTARYFDGERASFPEQSGGPLYAIDRALDSSNFTDQSAALGWRVQANTFWQSNLHASWYQRDEKISSPGISPYDAVPANGADTEFTRTHIRWINTLGNESRWWSNIGVETKKEEGTSQGYLDVGIKVPTDFTLSRRIDSAFININGYLVEDFLVQASVRRDDAENIAAKNSTQAGMRYALTESLTAFVNWGEGFKLPSFFALGHPLVGNAALQPETATTQDIGFEWKQDSLFFRSSYFAHEYRNLIDFDSDTFTNVNRARADTSGVESELRWQANAQWLWRLHGTYTDIDMLSSDNHLLGRPQVTAGSSVTYTLTDAWAFTVNYLWVDERYAVSRYRGSDIEETLSHYGRVDAIAYWQINSQARLGLNVENIGDKGYYSDIGFPAVGRNAQLNLTIAL